jgi:hypothetical protein
MSILMSLIQPVTKLLDKVIPDADAKQRIAHEIAVLAEKQAHELAKSQIEVNKAEAAHKNLFVAGWRPAVGWTCCLAMASNFLVIPQFCNRYSPYRPIHYVTCTYGYAWFRCNAYC